jgi:hypothetical protein
MSDFGAVLDYAMMLEAEAPAAALDKLAAMRPAAMGATKKEREEATKAAHQPAAPAHATAAADDKRK